MRPERTANKRGRTQVFRKFKGVFDRMNRMNRIWGSLKRSPQPLLLVMAGVAASFSARSETFLLPTANRALFESGGEERFFVGTVGKTWVSGTFGCVRSDGWQIHEGLDIRCLQRDKRGEPIAPVRTTADWAVAYI